MKLKILGASRQVTGSCYYLEAGGLRILIDCGLFQERDFVYRNWEHFPIPPDQIDYILLTHVHLDHSGLIPKLVREGFAGDIMTTSASKEMYPIVILDSARIQKEDAAFKKKRHRKEGRKGRYPEIPLYTVRDARLCFPLFKDVPYNEYIALNQSVKICFHDAGHILGSAMIEIFVHEKKGKKSIIFSGDMGQWDKPLVKDPTLFDRADYVVMESTYGNRNHDDPQDVEKKLCKVVNDTVKAGGNILIPTFAIERAQELLFHISRLAREKRIPYLMTFLNSPMAVEITKVFKRSQRFFDKETLDLFKRGHSPFDFPGLRLVQSVEASKAINQIRGSAIIMAGSGMITGGRIKHHLIRNITRSESTLLFVGYQAEGTLGRRILDGRPEVRIHGQSYPVKMRLVQIEGFSAHAGRNDLIRWLDHFKHPPGRVFLTHGEEKSILSLSSHLRSRGDWKVEAPRYQDEFEL
ncbi:MAG: MBL fold metallo-hydrolase [Candidatus Aminicenantaceae bacterium]